MERAALPWALVVGAKGAQRSQAAAEVVRRLSAGGVRVAGFLQETEGEPGKVRIALVRVGRGDRVELARSGSTPASPGELAHCDMIFSLPAFEAVRAWVEEDAPQAEVVVVGGLGKVEAGGLGHHRTIRQVLAGPALPLLVVRDEHLGAVVEAFQLETEPVAMLALPADEAALDAFAAAIRAASRA